MHKIPVQKIKETLFHLVKKISLKVNTSTPTKKFKSNNTTVEMHNVIAYSFDSDLLYASESDLKEHLKILCSYFPRTINDNQARDEKPIYENSNLIDVWHKAHQTVTTILQKHKDRKRFIIIASISLLTLVVLTATLTHRVLYTSKQHVSLKQLCTTKKSPVAINKNLSSPSPIINLTRGSKATWEKTHALYPKRYELGVNPSEN